MKITLGLAGTMLFAPYIFSKISLYHSPDSLTVIYLPSCPSITGRFFSNPLMNSGIVQSLYGASPVQLKSDVDAVKHITYSREFFSFADEGICSLDWVRTPSSSKILFIVPGLTGGSEAVYIKHIVLEGINRGYSVVVMNGRGISGTPLMVSHS